MTSVNRLVQFALRWGGEVNIRFCLHRFAGHLREHTNQVEKTLALLGRQPTKADRIARISLSAYGRLEGSLL